MNSSGPAGRKYRVVCVCGGYGFPLGNASAARIIMVGKTLQEAGIPFQLFHCGPDPFAVNKKRSGVYEGIPFQYMTPLTRPQNAFARTLMYLWGLSLLTFHLLRLRPLRRSVLVYLYCMDGAMNLYLGVLCRFLKVPVMQEMCEWFPGDPKCPRFTHWLYKSHIFKVSTGMLVISAAIEERVKERCAKVNPDLLIYRLPTIVDAQRLADMYVPDNSDAKTAKFVYCGTWLRDIFYLIRAFALLRSNGYQSKLVIIGAYARDNASAILEYARKQNVSPEDIVLAGYMDDATLEATYKTATALLMPLFNDDRSLTRLPNKLGWYLASGRPVITSKIGDLTNYLIDNVNAYVGEAGNERDFTDRMIAVLGDPERADEIGTAGQRECFAHLDYRSHVATLSNYVIDCILAYNQRSCPTGAPSGDQTVLEEMRQNS